ncbi:MAG: hypothetical protein JXR31_13490 [Prolixibacteraceae bacterium]|nr:hypothetical protein [Prolixibacteraceae bacterium]MBN2775263.1 hypothetical protein [Prolixibacteraceae bacterium]
MIETIGWTGNILFAICGLPQAVKTWKSKKTEDLSALFLWLWLLGELLTFIYIIIVDIRDHTSHFPLYFNYAFNLCLATYLVWAKINYPGKYRFKN